MTEPDHDPPHISDSMLDRLTDDLHRSPTLCDRCLGIYTNAANRLGEHDRELRVPPPLTPVELLLLQTAANGVKPGELHAVLGGNEHTVTSQLKSAREKLSVKTTLHACCEALRLGLIR